MLHQQNRLSSIILCCAILSQAITRTSSFVIPRILRQQDTPAFLGSEALVLESVIDSAPEDKVLLVEDSPEPIVSLSSSVNEGLQRNSKALIPMEFVFGSSLENEFVPKRFHSLKRTVPTFVVMKRSLTDNSFYGMRG